MITFFAYLRDNSGEVLQATEEHIALVLIAMVIAVAIGIPTGILLTRRPFLQRPVLGITNVMQTVPSLALFGLLLPLLGLGPRNAIVALVLYSLLPLVRNTMTGIQRVDPHVREAAVAMGMTESQILWQVELPLAASFILAGVRVATVLCIGVTTIASFIAAGGLGELIYNGLRNDDNAVTLSGAIPAALLALAADGALGALQARLEANTQPSAKKSSRWQRAAWVPALALLAVMVAGATQGVKSLARLGETHTADEGAAGAASTQSPFAVGSKDFTESRILAEIIAQAAESKGITVRRTGSLGGNLPHQALLAGQLDCYPEYTGTAYIEILKHKRLTDANAVYQAVKTEYASKFHLDAGPPLGFEDTFAMLVRGADARRLHLTSLSQVAPLSPQWQAGFGPDFIHRADGLPGLKKTYGLHFASVHSMDLSLINRALASGKVDIIAGNSTDGLIPTLDLFPLADDRHYFPPYQAVYILREAAIAEHPELSGILKNLAGSITTADMQKLNYQVDGKKRKVEDVVREWLRGRVTS